MAKKKNQSDDKISGNDQSLGEQESEVMPTEEVVETTQAVPVAQEVFDFDKAFRIFKKDNPKSKSWNTSAVEIFVRKRVTTKTAPLDAWLSAFSKY